MRTIYPTGTVVGLPDGVFNPLGRITTVDLRGNVIHYMPPEVFGPLLETVINLCVGVSPLTGVKAGPCGK